MCWHTEQEKQTSIQHELCDYNWSGTEWDDEGNPHPVTIKHPENKEGNM